MSDVPIELGEILKRGAYKLMKVLLETQEKRIF